jgi:hypothetical protein
MTGMMAKPFNLPAKPAAAATETPYPLTRTVISRNERLTVTCEMLAGMPSLKIIRSFSRCILKLFNLKSKIKPPRAK